MLNTYFFVNIVEPEITYGPYITFAEAAAIFMDHLDLLLSTSCKSPPKEYEATITECLIEASHKETIVEKAREKRTFRS